MESNFNPVKKTYNPHFHVLVGSAEMGQLLLNEWLEPGRRSSVNSYAQNIKKVDNNLTILIELIKYGNKIITERGVDKKSKANGNSTLYVSALNNIFDAMQGFRIFE